MRGSNLEKEILQLIQGLNKPSSEEEADGHNDHASDNWVMVKDNLIHTFVGKFAPGPIIHAEAPVRLIVNGIKIEGDYTVKQDDQIEWEIVREPEYKVLISDDAMTASLQLSTLNQYEWRLQDKEKASIARITAAEDTGKVISSLQLVNILESLQEMGIKNINVSAIERELLDPTFCPVIVSQGVPPIPSVDARIDLFFKENIESSFEEINGAIDFRNHLKIPTASKGDVVARKVLPVYGKNGFDVYGNTVEPNRPIDYIMIAKSNAALSGNNEIVATKKGRPKVTGDRIKFIEVNDCYVVSGDVNLETGNIFFTGDVVVYGDVTDGMLVESLGNVYVAGSVFRATVTATGSISVKGNVIGANLYSGQYGVLFNRLYNFSLSLHEQLQQLRNALKQLVGKLEERGLPFTFQQALRMLLESKFKEIPSLVKEILVCIANIQNIQSGMMSELKEKLLGLQDPMTVWDSSFYTYISSLQYLLVETFEHIKRSEETTVLCEFDQCHKSKILSNGDIVVYREGVLQSTLYSKQNIVFKDPDAICRGSTLEAGLSVSAAVVGGETGGEVTVKAGRRLLVHRMYGGKVVIDNRYIHQLSEPLYDVALYVSDNRLVIESIHKAD
ncbi:DUF342 domain-containing protein [Cohnella hongkongensis]|uniref:DUF342 domain-containing protein n=1 Tax=Cohnella hongkongensis TaxID=178337 RepID=A0ABV9F8W0_9BACL